VTTPLAEQLAPDQLLERLGEYHEIIVDAIRAERGDVLKFIGDGVLSIFPVEAGGREEDCARARRALEQALMKAADVGDLHFVGCLHIGPVTYGNIGSADRLGFRRRQIASRFPLRTGSRT
jgi:adenylate cyclase